MKKVVCLCVPLPGVQRSAYYDWQNQPGKKVIPWEELVLSLRLKALFAVSRGSLGSPMVSNLRAEGYEIGRDRTRGLVKALKLKV